MNLTWQIVKKDARAMSVPLAFWLFLLAADLLLGFWASRGGAGASARNNFEQFRLYHNLLQIVQLGLTFALAVDLVQGDPPAGPKTFWRTRPISRPRLLGAKLVAVALFFWLPPILLAIPWWLDSGLAAGDMATAALAILLRQIAVTLPAMALASLTTSLAQTIGVAIVGLLVAAATPPLAKLTANLAGAPSPDFVRPSPSLQLSLAGWILAGILACVMVAGLIQFLTGKTRLSWLVFAGIWACVVGSMATGIENPSSPFGLPRVDDFASRFGFDPSNPDDQPPLGRKTPLAGQISGVTFTVSQARLHRRYQSSPTAPAAPNQPARRNDRVLGALIDLQILAQFARSQTDLVVVPVHFEMNLGWPTLPGEGLLTRGGQFAGSNADRQALIAAQVLFPDGQFTLGPTNVATFPDNVWFESPAPPSLTGVLQFAVLQPAELSEARMQAGARSTARWRVVRWARGLDSASKILVHLIERSPEVARTPLEYFLDFGDIEGRSPESYALVDRAQGSFIAYPEDVSESHLRINGVNIAVRRLTFDGKDRRTVADYRGDLQPSGSQPTLDDGWLADAIVVCFKLEDSGKIDVTAPLVPTEWSEAPLSSP